MLRTKLIICITAWMSLTSAYAQVVTGNARYVDPFIGVDGGGNVFPGVCAPFGMVKLGPDCGNLKQPYMISLIPLFMGKEGVQSLYKHVFPSTFLNQSFHIVRYKE